MKNRQSLYWCLLVVVWVFMRPSAHAAVIKFEAESGTLGAEYAETNNSGVSFVYPLTTSAAESPGGDARAVTYSVTFPEAGTYDLYARVRVGSGGANDDSFFYGNGFGAKSTNAADWIRVNNLNVGGSTNAGDPVNGNGSAGTQVWKWVNLSEFSNGSSEAGQTFAVSTGALTQTFQIGAREDGFEVDAIVFGTSTYTFTVSDLDSGSDGDPLFIATGTSTVNWNDVRQRIDGFGASSAWRSTWSASVADLFFSTNNGIGLSLLRTRIAPGGNTVENIIMQLARDRGARVWSAPWSPSPVAQFKSNGNVNGGSFIGNTTNYQAYANQMAGYVARMKNQFNVSLYAVSVQNEPDANVTTYESCNWTPQQIHDFIPYLSAALAASNVSSTKIMLPESQNWASNPGLYTTTMNDASVAPLVGIIANHNYVPDNNNGDQSIPAPINSYGKALWETEVSTFSAFDTGITNAIYWARRIHLFLTVSQVNAWHYWWLSSANNDNSGLASPADVPAKRAYAVGQFSRFVRPDYFRIGVVTNQGNAPVSGYKDPVSSKFAIVAINQTGSLLNQTINLTNFGTVNTVTPWVTSVSLSLASQAAVTVSNSSFTYQLPPMSIVTFVGQVAATNAAPTLTAISDKTVGAGAMLVVTNLASDPNAPPQVLTFSLVGSPTNSSLNTSNGVFTWRPPVSLAGTTNTVTVTVSDNGSPSLKATNSFKVAVNLLGQTTVESIASTGGQVQLMVSGPAGPDYSLLVSTNLTAWQVLFTTPSPALPVSLVDSNAVPGEVRFYRVRLGP